MNKKIALTGGGTAGHIMPNIALIPELKNMNFDIIYIGGKNGMESGIISKHNIRFFGITVDKLRRYFDLKNFLMPYHVVKGIFEAKKILKFEKVDIVFSKGGFVSVPVVIAAYMLNIPIISHESDITLGLANTIAKIFSKKVCCNFKETLKYLGNKGIHTGSPIRKELLEGNIHNGKKYLGFTNDKPILFVTGGSLGSRYINKLIYDSLDFLIKDYNVVHQCGKNNINNSINLDGYIQFETIDEKLNDIFAASEFVISRAGANIIFELLALKKPNILIPLSKKASRGDQILNALSFENNNYSIVMFEDDTPNKVKTLLNKIKELNTNKQSIINSMNMAKENNSIKNICEIIYKYA